MSRDLKIEITTPQKATTTTTTAGVALFIVLVVVVVAALFRIISYAVLFVARYKTSLSPHRVAVSAYISLSLYLTGLWFLALTLFILNFHKISWNSCTRTHAPITICCYSFSN